MPHISKESLQGLKHLLLKKDYADWTSVDLIERALNETLASYDSDHEALNKQAVNLFDTSISVKETTNITVDLFRSWTIDKPVSLSALISWATEHMEITLSPDLFQALMLASVLGEVENTCLYHNNLHFKKVVLQTIRQIIMHNDLFDGTRRELDNEQIGLLLLAACIHDLGHDGTGNMSRGVFKQSRLELHSLEILAQYLSDLGITQDDKRWQAIQTMILATDVTPINDPTNPSNQTKAAYRFHYLGDNKKVDSVHLDPSLKAMQKNPSFSLMGLLLHEADIATSAGLTYEMTQYETIIYRLEVCEDRACPKHVLDFLDNICQRQFITDSGQKLFGANLARILAKVETDIENGNEIFTALSESAFIKNTLSVHSKAEGNA